MLTLEQWKSGGFDKLPVAARVKLFQPVFPVPVSDDFVINPTLSVLGSPEWLSWREPLTQQPRIKRASAADLQAIRQTSQADHDALRGAVFQGLLIPSRRMLQRQPSHYAHCGTMHPNFVYIAWFTIQWHLTHACELHCKHCYTARRGGKQTTLEQGEAILDKLKIFCQERYVQGSVCFSGGNPLLSPAFFDLYASALRRGFTASIMGNATTEDNVRRILEIGKPSFYQVSLEGLEEHNDFIRGRGYFQKVLRFLEVLRRHQVHSMVMLTLTRDNMDQVLPLAEQLRGRVDTFCFNRICATGHGANLLHPDKDKYAAFVDAYLQARRNNPIMSLKDNFINIALDKGGQRYFGGCTGYGCGAAFNFIAVLPDGAAHACRKFPSPIGNLNEQGLSEVWDSPAAAAYRGGSTACHDCRLRPVCGGCLAVVNGLGMDIYRDRDPFCFFAP